MILLSARAGEEARIEGLQAGADEYLVKPFSARELLASVASQLQLARVRASRRPSGRACCRRTPPSPRRSTMSAPSSPPISIATKVVQAVTDAATELTTAEFGAFFYNVVERVAAKSYTLYTISGVPREAFSKFPMPRNTEVFEPTFKGTGVVRSADITQGSALRPQRAVSRHAAGPPAGAQLSGRAGQGPVGRRRSADCSSATPTVGRFSEHHERLAVGVASWASVALENAQPVHERAGGEPPEGRLPGQPLARAAHAAERHPRLRAHAALGHGRRPSKQQKAIETIERNATSLTQIVEDVLDISRIVSGKIRLNVQTGRFPGRRAERDRRHRARRRREGRPRRDGARSAGRRRSPAIPSVCSRCCGICCRTP